MSLVFLFETVVTIQPLLSAVPGVPGGIWAPGPPLSLSTGALYGALGLSTPWHRSRLQRVSPLVYVVKNPKLRLIYTARGSLGNVLCHLFAAL